jgi:hypothetical protein
LGRRVPSPKTIEAVVAFEPLAIVFDLTAGLERVLRLRPGGEDNNGASDDQRGAHTPMRADRVSPCKAGESRGAIIAVRYARSSPETAALRDFAADRESNGLSFRKRQVIRQVLANKKDDEAAK